MTVKKIIGKLHLWLGLTSGLVVFIIAITGCIYAFQEEIQDLTQPYRHVEAQSKSFLPPSKLREIADEQLPGKHIHSVLYQGENRAAKAIYYSFEENYYDFVYINQYNGKVLKVKDEYKDFFRIVLDGHFYLWLPHEIGQPVVATATLIFLVMLISGLFLWWPRNKNGVKQRFTIKWNARWRRKNYDLHNVFGFYVTWIAIILALTGLVWGFTWFRDAVYDMAGGEKSLTYQEPLSDTTEAVLKLPSRHSRAGGNPLYDKGIPDLRYASSGMTIKSLFLRQPQANAVDILWEKMKAAYSTAESIEIHFPVDENSSILAAINPDASTYWKIDYIYFDQYSLKEIPANHIWDRFESATPADKLMRMNYDIHTGAIVGLPGKILAFFASLIVASLPVTGFYIWWGRKHKQRDVKETREIKSLGYSQKNHKRSVRVPNGQPKAPIDLYVPKAKVQNHTKNEHNHGTSL